MGAEFLSVQGDERNLEIVIMIVGVVDMIRFY